MVMSKKKKILFVAKTALIPRLDDGACAFGGVYASVFTRVPDGSTVGDSGLCSCVPCLLSAVNSLYLMGHDEREGERRQALR